MRLLALLTLGAIGLFAAELSKNEPETVMVTFHAKAGAEAELERVIARHWTTGRQMKLMSDAPHVTLRGSEEGGKIFFVEIFTWGDAKTPDKAPAAIREIWGEMNRLVEARGGHAGLEFTEVAAVTSASTQ